MFTVTYNKKRSYRTIYFGEWIDDVQFYVLFNSISVISGRWKTNHECVLWKPVYSQRNSASRRNLTRTARCLILTLTAHFKISGWTENSELVANIFISERDDI